MNKKLLFKLKHPIMYIRLKIRLRKEIKDFPKLLLVVLSCENYAQCKSAFFYLERYMRFHNMKGSKNKQNLLTNMIMERIAMYLQDTMEHDIKSFHHSQIRGDELTKTWPDLTEYVGVLLDLRFPKVWTKGCSIVQGALDG